MADNWLSMVKAANKTCLVKDGRRKIHFTFKDGLEMAEEYDVRTNNLIVRKWKKKTVTKGDGKWEFEVGEQPVVRNPETEGGLVPTATNPIFMRKDSGKAFEWRVRNLPYPKDTYDVQVNPEENVIIIRTSNKKYYKRFNIPDVDRVKVKLEQRRLSIAHSNNTLIITYQKPPEVLALERAVLEELRNVRTVRDEDLPSDCKQS